MKDIAEFLTENNPISLSIRSAAGLGGSYIAAISPGMQDVHWWVSFVGVSAGAIVALGSAVSIWIGIIRQIRKYWTEKELREIQARNEAIQKAIETAPEI